MRKDFGFTPTKPEIISIQKLLFVMSVAKVFRPIVAMDMERYEPGISPSHCRNLFGPVDHEQVRTELEEELRRIVKEKERRWNFDFVNERPLAGDFLWQRIGDNRTVGFSTIATPTEGRSASQAPVVDTDNSTTTCEENAKPMKQSPSNSKVNCMKTPERVTTKPQRRSPRITDYLRGRKKSATSREIKFSRHAGDDRLTSTKQVQTGKSHGRGRTGKQSTLDELLPKLRPRHASGKTSS